jgi:hypothetical protein
VPAGNVSSQRLCATRHANAVAHPESR